MHSLLTQLGLFTATALVLLYARIARGISYSGGVPRVGKPGVLGYLRTALRWTVDGGTVIAEGRHKYGGKPFVVPMLSGPVFLLGPEWLERIRAGPDSVYNDPAAVNDDLQLAYTMDGDQLTKPYHARALRTDVNRAIPSFIPDLLDESLLAIHDEMPSDINNIEAFETMTRLIARISNRVILGTEMCRNKDFLRAVVRFAESVAAMAPFIQWSPILLRPVTYYILSLLVGSKKEPLKYTVPYITRFIEERKTTSERANLVLEYVVAAAPPEETVPGIAIRLLNINFASIHTSSLFLTQALFEIALLSPKDVDGIRTEVQDALESEGGWTRDAMAKFYKIDSALREVGRCYGLMHYGLPRLAMVATDLGDGTFIPPGHRVAIDMKAIHYNPETYPDPEKCDLFRFSKLREKEGVDPNDTKYGFSTIDSHYLPFGAGRHSCAGRNFASMELKIMIAHMLLKYDITLPPGMGRAKNLIFNGAVIPDPKAHLIFTVRSKA
ncbi:cytochrome P450 [Panaeolus papilionaceus]|nr:cytochrome P450 [Panaeolus papilionaceus]